MIQDKKWVELNSNFKFKNTEGRNNVYSSACIPKWGKHVNNVNIVFFLTEIVYLRG